MNDRDRVARTMTDPQRLLWRDDVEGIGLSQFLPGMVEPDGFNHPIFGPHYRLTATGIAVRDHLKGQP